MPLRDQVNRAYAYILRLFGYPKEEDASAASTPSPRGHLAFANKDTSAVNKTNNPTNIHGNSIPLSFDGAKNVKFTREFSMSVLNSPSKGM